MNNQNVEDSLISTLKKSDLKSIGYDVAEVAIDSFLQDGFLKDLPVISFLNSLYKTGIHIRDYFFTKKLLKFLYSLSTLSPQQRTEFIDRLDSDPKYTQKVGESIMLLLDRMDDMNKPILMGRAFKAYALGKINSIELQRINYAIDKILMCDISELEEFSKVETKEINENTCINFDKIVSQNFLSAGLAYIHTGAGVAGKIYSNAICELFVKHIIKG